MIDTNQERDPTRTGLCLTNATRSVFIRPDADTWPTVVLCLDKQGIDYTLMSLTDYIMQQGKAGADLTVWEVNALGLSRCLKNIVSVFGGAQIHPVNGRIDEL